MNWTTQDEAEYHRLEKEMAEDAKWQLQLFTFAITAAAILLGVLAPNPTQPSAVVSSKIPTGLFFLVPLLILIPTSLMVLNRARTRNRKAAYIMVSLDYKRLQIDGVQPTTSLADVRHRVDLPWETALHILERTNKALGKKPHLAPALLYMAVSYGAIELVCIALALTAVWSAGLPLMAITCTVLVLDVLLIWFRFKVLLQLRKETSIQGYVANWLRLIFSSRDDIPRYLREWVDECVELSQSAVFRV